MSDQEKKVSASIPQTEREAINYGRGGFYAPEGTAEQLAKMQNAVADAYHRSSPITIDLSEAVLAAGSPNSLCPEVQEDFKSTAEPSDIAAKINAMSNGTRTVNLMDGENWTNFREAVEKQGTFPLPEVFFPTIDLSATGHAIKPEDAAQGYSWPVSVSVNHDATHDMAAHAELDLSNITPLPGFAAAFNAAVEEPSHMEGWLAKNTEPTGPGPYGRIPHIEIDIVASYPQPTEPNASTISVHQLIEQRSVSEHFRDWTVQIETPGAPEVGEGVKEMAQQILDQTGMSAKELIANSSVNDNHPLVFGDMTPRPVETLPVTRADDSKPIEVEPAVQEEDSVPEENLRKTIVPIPTELIREYFTNKGIFYLVDYRGSRLKGAAFLTYLTNLAVPSDLIFENGLEYEEYSELMKAYMDQRSVVSCAILHVMAAELLLYAKGQFYHRLPYVTPVPVASYLERFIDENKEQVGRWLHFLDSTQVFALSAIKRLNAHYKPKELFENIDDKEYVGSNIAQLYRIPAFIAYYFSIEGAEYKLSYFTQQYEEYMFKNERLAKYFRSPHNFAAMMFEHLALGNIEVSDVDHSSLFNNGAFDPAKGIPKYDPTAPASED